ncbi:MAG: thiol:disulfide interchange protein DsbA/DsbL [Rhodocyclaceae bacterium]|jgi:thiol:disulfide interchange protein DsbA|nr:thiol:disulfide interchange protein DsbA/DsbL [Rhodocyclaceae bacterium]MCL4758429.1 thiol:disulfide interchange protein DsbA/DsbL [Rhodocyclaceae bacterium]
MNRRAMLKQLSVLGLLASAGPAVLAQENLRFRKMPNRIAPEEAGKIEVLEFFHYGCPHCRDFHPLIKQWLESLPGDVAFRAVPVIWGNEQLRGLARLHYTAERTGTLAKLQDGIFAGVQDERLPLFTEEGVADWVGKYDVDAKAFMDTYKSFALQALVQRADQVTRAYKVQGVPTMAVDGQYITSASVAGSHENALAVVDKLIEMVRTEGGRS